MNFVVIMTDTQTKWQVGAYGLPQVDTPNLDRLAAEGIRFERAYTTCPVCTPARAGIFSGLHPQVAGAWCNNVAPHNQTALLGTIFRQFGFRAAYTGKWHLDGSDYFGDGQPGGGFEPDWWYDGKRYAEDIGREMFQVYLKGSEPQFLRASGFTQDYVWGHRVANRAADFLERVGKEPFVLVCSFDESHGPSPAPPEYLEQFTGDEIPMRPNYAAPLTHKPELQRVQRREHGEMPWDEYRKGHYWRRWHGCNSYIDREIGRVIDAVTRRHADDTVIIYTSDHGGQAGSHGLHSKGPMMYEESANIPFIIRMPGGPKGSASQALVSHVDIIPTMLDLAGIQRPDVLQGVSLAPMLRDSSSAGVRESVLSGFQRFAINHDSYGGFYPIRCMVNARYKLVVNLLDSDELYDLRADPYEMDNLIESAEHASARDELHDRMLDEMDRIRDPFRSFLWGHRTWRSARSMTYSGPHRRRPGSFPFQPESLRL